jgi:hypothetical protein
MRTSFSHTAERFGSNSKLNPWKAQSDSEVQYRDLEKMSIGNEQDLKDYKIKHRQTLLFTFILMEDCSLTSDHFTTQNEKHYK